MNIMLNINEYLFSICFFYATLFSKKYHFFCLKWGFLTKITLKRNNQKINIFY